MLNLRNLFVAQGRQGPVGLIGRDMGAMEEDNEMLTCRICLESEIAEGDQLLAPCLCRGSSKFVHRSCLDQWRVSGFDPKTVTHCGTCKGAEREVWAEIVSNPGCCRIEKGFRQRKVMFPNLSLPLEVLWRPNLQQAPTEAQLAQEEALYAAQQEAIRMQEPLRQPIGLEKKPPAEPNTQAEEEDDMEEAEEEFTDDEGALFGPPNRAVLHCCDIAWFLHPMAHGRRVADIIQRDSQSFDSWHIEHICLGWRLGHCTSPLVPESVRLSPTWLELRWKGCDHCPVGHCCYHWSDLPLVSTLQRRSCSQRSHVNHVSWRRPVSGLWEIAQAGQNVASANLRFRNKEMRKRVVERYPVMNYDCDVNDKTTTGGPDIGQDEIVGAIKSE
eukprot:symbB.v1.2.027452.t1/scaffold2817.1/size69569/7